MASCKDRVLDVIRAPSLAPKGLNFSAVFVLLQLFVFLLAVGTDHWLTSSVLINGYDSRNQGLWRTCFGSLGVECCGYINDVIYIEPFLHATRAFIVMGLLGQGLSLFILLLAIFCYSGDTTKQGEMQVVSGILAGLSAFCILLAIIIYGGASQDEDSTSIYSLSWSYALCVITGILYIPLSCFICLKD